MIRFSLSLLFAFTGLASSSSGYDIGFITYAKYMHNKEFHPRKLPNLDLQNIKKRERKILLIFTIFLLHFFCLYSPQKTSNFSFKDLPARSSYFQRRALWYVNNREQKKVEWHKDFLVFFLGGVQTLNLQNYYALQEEAEDSMQIFFLRWPVMHFFHRA